MAFSIAHYGEPPQVIWCQVTDGDTIYVGQLVKIGTNEGVDPLGSASGAADTTNKAIPLGIVVGTNRKVPQYSSTYKTEYITDVSPASNTNEYVLVDGPYPKGDNVAMVEVAIITPNTVLRGPIFRGAVGTALTQNTVTAAQGGAIHATLDSGVTFADTSVTSTYETAYFRSGANRGTYRVLDSRSSVGLTWDKPLKSSASNDDQVIIVPGLRPCGIARMQTDSEAMYIDGTANASSNYWSILVHRLDLAKTGEEYAEFRFSTCHFDPVRA